ncbi:XRE family transcriptional regulator [Brevibacillus laterosporus]|uniref:Helix-turn-helix domain protein n=1 Tax=Brevibacillus laterosporus LMG 15441 TaxID=1042163 RepID=A0A075R103_BRELA|nr:helix-turn-helix transcriptional regulator [Brevibacillus laterosporus]AIG25141.1 helix-turn-helix domain protein [Brevibacillus laterosporus LMG 15441]RJL06586.1 XRE family transcriptional regulator [Brevibacillus laterosporus]TPH11769.1 XRE family transcriptional regulator [Brevibacillus laterosporus]
MYAFEYNHQVAQIELRQRLQESLDSKGWKQKDLVQATGMDSATISQLMNNRRRMTLPQLETITRALQIQMDTFYECFLGECFNETGKLSPVKTAEFFIGCIKAERYDITKKIMDFINEDTDRKRLVDNTFKMAEHIFLSEQRNYSLPLYDIVINNSSTRNEQLAIAYFRRFIIARDVDITVSGYETLYQLLEYLPLLPQEYKFDAYYKILTFYNVVEKWDKLLKYAKELKELATSENEKKYITEALLYEVASYEGLKDYKTALHVIKEYATYGNEYEELAKINETLLLIEMGHVEYIEEHIKLIACDLNKLCVFLPVAIETYLQKDMLQNIGELLCSFEKEIMEICSKTHILIKRHKLKLFQALSAYYFIKGEKDKGFKYNLEAIQLALMFKNVERLRSLILLHYQNDPSEEQKEEFVTIMTRGNNQYEENMDFITGDSVLIRFYRNQLGNSFVSNT